MHKVKYGDGMLWKL